MQPNGAAYAAEQTGPAGCRAGVAGLILPLVLAVLLAACQHGAASGLREAPAPVPAAESGAPLNKDWGNCRFRRCDIGK